MTFGFAYQAVASKLCFRDKYQLKLPLWWPGVCSERVKISPNAWCGATFASFAESTKIWSDMILSHVVVGAIFCAGFEPWKCNFRGRES